ncbi:UNVERIFIED_CONTAM: hypothetical protein GTU68_010386 [Idotea baltica]|nr:hypothetical protein [Idotea baltica]
MEAKLYALVALGGGIGSALRFFISERCRVLNEDFPLGTLSVNLIGSLLVGLLAGFVFSRPNLPESFRVFLMLGVLGGFTTFSNFSYDSISLIRAGMLSQALLNILVQLVGGILLAGLGFYFGRAVFS